jgi:hypothetical protein
VSFNIATARKTHIMVAVLVTATLYQEITKEALVYIISLFVTPLTSHVIVFIMHTMNQMCVICIRKEIKHIDILLILYKEKCLKIP